MADSGDQRFELQRRDQRLCGTWPVAGGAVGERGCG